MNASGRAANDEPSDSADLIRVGHRVAAAVARAIANPCGILHREGLVDIARGAAPGPDSYE